MVIPAACLSRFSKSADARTEALSVWLSSAEAACILLNGVRVSGLDANVDDGRGTGLVHTGGLSLQVCHAGRRNNEGVVIDVPVRLSSAQANVGQGQHRGCQYRPQPDRQRS